MKVTSTELPGLLVVQPQRYSDDRGFFQESWNAQVFCRDVGQDVPFVQDNHSRSRGGVLRGLHYQIDHPQGKLVSVVRGRIFDVAVDLRRSSPTFGRWHGLELSDENQNQFWIPVGFAHGFLALSDWADVIYKTTDYYSPQHERCLIWNDPSLGIEWPLDREPILSAKDMRGLQLHQLEHFS